MLQEIESSRSGTSGGRVSLILLAGSISLRIFHHHFANENICRTTEKAALSRSSRSTLSGYFPKCLFHSERAGKEVSSTIYINLNKTKTQRKKILLRGVRLLIIPSPIIPLQARLKFGATVSLKIRKILYLDKI